LLEKIASDNAESATCLSLRGVIETSAKSITVVDCDNSLKEQVRRVVEVIRDVLSQLRR
jgi:hypothetical protein